MDYRFVNCGEKHSTADTAPNYVVSVCAQHTHGPPGAKFLAGERMPCFLGLSPTTPFVNRGRLHAILRWLVPRSSSLLIVEGLWASRWNLVAIRGLTMQQATDEVRRDIGRLRRRVDDIVSRPPRASVTFLDWQRELEGKQYGEIQAAICRYAETQVDFQSVLRETTRGYVHKVHPGEANRLTAAQWDTLSLYVVEELAMFLHLYRLRYKIEVYPGSDLEIVEATCAGRFANFPVPSLERSHVSLELTCP